MALAMLLLAGCAATPDAEEAPPPPPPQPLELDPTDEIDLSQWWSNGRELLQLAPDGRYALHPSQNRHRQPADRGRWMRDSYAVLWLEPYGTRQPLRRRVAIVRRQGELTLEVDRLDPMVAIDRPPWVQEDDLFGRWESTIGVLHLDLDMRYFFAPSPMVLERPWLPVGHSGRWRVAGQAVLLEPLPAHLQPVSLPIRTENETLKLASPDPEAVFERVRP
jgi:hypothetical protein